MLANIIRNAKKTGIGGGGGGVVTGGDPYYSAVSLLLPMDGTNGSTTFTDSGPNALTITPTGTTISTSQAKYGASGYFNGTSAYLTAASSAVTLGTSDFTIEFWVYPLDVRTFSLYDSRTNETNPNGNGFVIGTSASQAWVVYQAANRIVGPTVVANQWTHVAVTRSGSSVKMWINGVQVGSTWTTTGSFSDGATLIGTDYPKNARFVYGYIDDFRISQFARYVSTFTPPTAALPTTASSTPADPYYGYTSLLLHMDGSSGSTNFVDSGPNALTVTSVGSAQISTTQSKFGGASGIFNGSSSYLSVTGSTSLFSFSGDFTVEGFVYFSALPTSGNYAGFFFARGASASASAFQYYMFNNAGTYRLESTISVGATDYQGTYDLPSAPATGVWYHVAFVRSGTSVKAYWNGIQVGSEGTVSGTTNTPSTQIAIGGRGTPYTGLYLNGFIDEFRVTKYARYTSAFTPPSQAHLEYANGNDRYFSNVSLLLHMDGANGSTTFTDNSANARTITAVGNAQISTTQSQFGGASAYFDGTGDYLSFTGGMPSGSGTAFTIECWIRLDDLSAYRAITRTAGGLDIGVQPSGMVVCDQTGVGVIADSATGIITAGTWYHIAVTRDTSNAYKVYVNGTQVASGTNSFSVTAATTIGYSAYSGAHYFKGYIDDFRATNALRYTSNFTPSASAFPNA